MKAFLQHGASPGPFMTESVDAKAAPMWWHDAGRTYTASGYGAKIPTRYMVRYLNRWRRVYCCIYSNSGTCYIGKNLREGVIVSGIDA